MTLARLRTSHEAEAENVKRLTIGEVSGSFRAFILPCLLISSVISIARRVSPGHGRGLFPSGGTIYGCVICLADNTPADLRVVVPLAIEVILGVVLSPFLQRQRVKDRE